MHLFSAHTTLSIFVSFALFVILALVGLNALVAVVLAVVAGPLLIFGLFSDQADRLEHWMTTMR